VIRLTAESETEISKNAKLGHENAMQASIVESTSLQHQGTHSLQLQSQVNTNYFIF